MNQISQDPQPPIDTNGDADFVAMLDVLIGSRWLIASVMAGFIFVGAAYALLAKPVYQADILVQVEDSPDTSAAKSLLGDVSSMFDVKSSASAETQILASRLVVSRAVDNLHLFVIARPLRFPVIGNWIAHRNGGLSKPGFMGLGGYTWGGESIDVPIFNVPEALEGDAFTVTALGGGRYRLSGSDLEASIEGTVGTLERFTTSRGMIELRIDAISAMPGANFKLVRKSRLQTILDLQDKLNVQEKIKQSDVMVASLQDTDPQLVSRAMNEIGRQYIRQNVERKSAEAAQSLEFLSGQLPQLKDQLNESEARLTKFRAQHGTVDLTEEARLSLAQTADAKTRLLELQQKRQELLSHLMDRHPDVVAIDEQIAALGAYRDQAEKQIRQLPDLQQDSLRLMLEVKVNTDLYTALVNNMQQLQLIRAGKVGNVRLVDTAAVPETPVKPKKLLVMVASAMLGLLVGCGTALARTMLFRGISDANEIEQCLGLSVYATVPLSNRQKALSEQTKTGGPDVLLLSYVFPNDPAVESLRSLRTALQFAIVEAKNNVVVIAGPAPGAGKSFISSNLAAVLAMAGKRVLLVDGDMRKGRLHEYLGLVRGRGLSELIESNAPFDDVLHSNVIDGLDFLSTGALPKNPAELLLNSRLAKLIEAFSKSYDVVVIDSPPVLAVADTGTLASMAGTTFLVARAEATRLGELTESAKRLAQNGVRLNGIVFNGANPRLEQSRFGSKYGGYRYVAYEYGADQDA